MQRTGLIGIQTRLSRAVPEKSGCQGAFILAVLAAFLGALTGCGGSAADITTRDSRVNSIRLPDGGLQPGAVLDESARLHLIYVTGEPGQADIFYIHSGDFGSTFTDPIRVNSEPGSAIATGTVRGPQLAVGKDGRVHVAWMGSRDATPKAPRGTTPMLYARMNDDRTGFEPQRNLIQARPGLDGGGTVAADDVGNVYVAWHAPEVHPGTEADRRIWVAGSRDEGRTFSAETAADPEPVGTCGCCGMRAATDARGNLLMAYRSAAGTGTRDVHLLASANGIDRFKGWKIHEWEVGYCMMSTFDFWTDRRNTLLAWETDGQIYFGIVDAQTAGLTKMVSAPGTGDNRKHPALARNAREEVLLAWTEGTGWNRGGRVLWQVFDRDLEPVPDKDGQTGGLPAWGRPAAFATPDGDFVLIY